MDSVEQIGKSEFRKNLLNILNDMARGLSQSLLITDHGQAQAVIIPIGEYQEMMIKIQDYEAQAKPKLSIWGDSVEVTEDLENHSWAYLHDEILAKWDQANND